MTSTSQARGNGFDRTAEALPPKILTSTSPVNGLKLGEVRTTSLADLPALLERTRRAQRAWMEAGLPHRLGLLRNLKEAFWRNMDLITQTSGAETGKPLFEAVCEYWASIEMLAYYLRSAGRVLAPKGMFVGMAPHRKLRLERRPHGVVAVIAPWNFPIYLALAPIAAALVAGNTVVFKPSEFATQTGEMLARLIYEAGFPRDVFQIVHGEGDVGAALIRAKPDKIVFTGSVPTGRKIAAAAADSLIPVTLELGSKDASLVLEDADLDRAAHGIVAGGMLNSGQACLSVEQIYVMRSVAEALTEKMIRIIKTHIHLDKGKINSEGFSAITTPAQLRIIDEQVREAASKGAKIILGGQPLTQDGGRYYEPTLITETTSDMRIMQDETFGPVVVITVVDSVEEALAQLEASTFGLTASIYSRDQVYAATLARRIHVGHVAINDTIMSLNLPQLPWGGFRDSGYGRTRGDEGLLDMTANQTISSDRFGRAWPIIDTFFGPPYSGAKVGLMRRLVRFTYASGLAAKIQALFE